MTSIPVPSSSSSDSVLESIDKFVFQLFAGFLLALSKGWAISVLWGWFIAGPFGAPRIGIALGIGIAFVYSAISINMPKTIKDTADDKTPWTKSVATSFAASVIAYPMAVGVGWIVHLFL